AIAAAMSTRFGHRPSFELIAARSRAILPASGCDCASGILESCLAILGELKEFSARATSMSRRVRVLSIEWGQARARSRSSAAEPIHWLSRKWTKYRVMTEKIGRVCTAASGHLSIEIAGASRAEK